MKVKSRNRGCQVYPKVDREQQFNYRVKANNVFEVWLFVN